MSASEYTFTVAGSRDRLALPANYGHLANCCDGLSTWISAAQRIGSPACTSHRLHSACRKRPIGHLVRPIRLVYFAVVGTIWPSGRLGLGMKPIPLSFKLPHLLLERVYCNSAATIRSVYMSTKYVGYLHLAKWLIGWNTNRKLLEST